MSNKSWQLRIGKDPVIITAIHDGHKVREEFKDILKLTNKKRLREEDPFTGSWTSVGN